jgi:hypothetical protein
LLRSNFFHALPFPLVRLALTPADARVLSSFGTARS